MQRSVRNPLSFLAFLLFGFAVSTAEAQHTLEIADASAAGFQPETVDVLLSSPGETEGFVLSITFDPSLISVSDVGVEGTVTEDVGAELVVPEIFAATGGFTLGVVLDASPPFAGQTIAPATSDAIANFAVTAVDIVAAETTTPIEFTDGLNSPPLDNILVQGGRSIGFDNGLTGIDGTFTLLPPPPDALRIEDVTIPAGGSAAARILMSNSSGAVQGFVLAIAHEDGLTLNSIHLNGTVTASAGAEFVVPTLHPTGGTLGVVLDFNSPFGGQTIGVGADQHIANFVYRCDEPPVDPAPATEFALSFADGAFGSPPLSNVIVVAGLSVAPGLTDGVASCQPVPLENTEFLCGVDAGFGQILEPTGFPGGSLELDLFYVDPDDCIQGFQIAMCFDPVFTVVPGSFSVEGTLLDAVGAEFVNASYDNSSVDGDGVELTVGILLDALPPFEDQKLSTTEIPLRMGSFTVDISETAQCDTCYDVRFCNGVDASEAIPVDNLVVIDYRSVGGFATSDCTICMVPDSTFVRGDCNTDTRVDIADAASVLGRQFSGLQVGCVDACDANDDGRADLADAVFLLSYLFKSGLAPVAPFPGAGIDTTEDQLDCDSGLSVCP